MKFLRKWRECHSRTAKMENEQLSQIQGKELIEDMNEIEKARLEEPSDNRRFNIIGNTLQVMVKLIPLQDSVVQKIIGKVEEFKSDIPRLLYDSVKSHDKELKNC